MGYVVREIQPTPNPNAAKFLLDREISEAPLSFLDPAQGEGHVIASQLFSVTGVASLLMLGDFVTVNKRPEAKWGDITPHVKEILKKSE